MTTSKVVDHSHVKTPIIWGVYEKVWITWGGGVYVNFALKKGGLRKISEFITISTHPLPPILNEHSLKYTFNILKCMHIPGIFDSPTQERWYHLFGHFSLAHRTFSSVFFLLQEQFDELPDSMQSREQYHS